MITGASSGIGEALCKHYANENVSIALVARRKDLLENVAEQCEILGANTYIYNCDVTNQQEIGLAAKAFIDAVGVPDIVIANAGTRVEEDIFFKNTDACEENMKVNYFGLVNTFLPFIESMTDAKHGHFVAISSIGSLRSTPNSGAYSASKSAVNLWTEGLRLRMKSYNISVTTICLGFVDTGMTEELDFWMPGILTSDEAAIKISRVIEKKERQIILPFTAKFIWGIFMYMPDKLYDRFIIFMRKILTKK